PVRSFGTAAVWARAVAAGTIASRNGKPNATPTPLSTALREICFFVMNISFLWVSELPLLARRGRPRRLKIVTLPKPSARRGGLQPPQKGRPPPPRRRLRQRYNSESARRPLLARRGQSANHDHQKTST